MGDPVCRLTECVMSVKKKLESTPHGGELVFLSLLARIIQTDFPQHHRPFDVLRAKFSHLPPVIDNMFNIVETHMALEKVAREWQALSTWASSELKLPALWEDMTKANVVIEMHADSEQPTAMRFRMLQTLTKLVHSSWPLPFGDEKFSFQECRLVLGYSPVIRTLDTQELTFNDDHQLFVALNPFFEKSLLEMFPRTKTGEVRIYVRDLFGIIVQCQVHVTKIASNMFSGMPGIL